MGSEKYYTIVKAFIGFFILAVLIYKIGLTEVYLSLVTFNFIFIVPIIVTYLLAFFIMAVNTQLLLRPLGKKINFLRLFNYNTLLWALGLFAPAKLGEMSLIYFLKKEGIPIGQAAAVFFVDRTITLLTLYILSIVGFYLFLPLRAGLFLTILFSTLIFFLFFMISETGRNLIKTYLLRSFSPQFTGFSETLRIYKSHQNVLLINFFLTVIKWAIHATTIMITFFSFGEKVAFVNILLINAVTLILSLLPISISGLGIREVGAVYLFSLVGVNTSITMGTYLILDVINYCSAVFFLVRSNIQLGKK